MLYTIYFLVRQNCTYYNHQLNLNLLLFCNAKDEMLRQVVIVDEEVGAILNRIRNEYKYYILFSKLLYENDSICTDTFSDIPVIDYYIIRICIKIYFIYIYTINRLIS